MLRKQQIAENKDYIILLITKYRRTLMKKLCMVMLLVCLTLTAACGKPKAADNTIRLQGKIEAVLYTVKAPVD